MIGLPFLIAGYIFKFTGIALATAGGAMIDLGMFLVRMPGRAWRWITRRGS